MLQSASAGALPMHSTANTWSGMSNPQMVPYSQPGMQQSQQMVPYGQPNMPPGQQMVPYGSQQGMASSSSQPILPYMPSTLEPSNQVIAYAQPAGMDFGNTTHQLARLPQRKRPNYEPGRQKILDEVARANVKVFGPEARAKGRARAAKPLEARIKGMWNKDEVLASLDDRIEKYARRHGHGDVEMGRKQLLRDNRGQQEDGHVRQKELAILDEMRKDEEAGALKLPVESSVDRSLSTGLREYVDYAADEVERFNNAAKAGVITAEFDWSLCGDSHDVPVLRRSSTANRVDGPSSFKPKYGHGTDEMFETDFLRDFCRRDLNIPNPTEQQTLHEMALAADDMREKALFRADTGFPLGPDLDLSCFDRDDIVLPQIEPRSFRHREWAVEYSVV